MSEETERKILHMLDVLAVEVASGRDDIRGLDAKVTGLDAKVDALDAKVERVERRLGRLETRVEGVETETRLFRIEFERRVAPLERRRKS